MSNRHYMLWNGAEKFKTYKQKTKKIADVASCSEGQFVALTVLSHHYERYQRRQSAPITA